MKVELLHEFGVTKNVTLVKANEAQKGEEYFCPGCNDKFILKKSGNIGKGSRRPHFAHDNLDGSCSYESYLHNAFKIRTFEIIKENINKGLPLNITWKCDYCNNQHCIDLIGIYNAKLEHNMIERVPDIALFDRNGRVCLVIEIVYKHPPEDGAIKFYRENNIILIQIIISSDNDLNDVENKLMNPSSVGWCAIPQKPIYRQSLPIHRDYVNTVSQNRVPHDFIDNPQKYYTKNGSFYKKKGWRKY